MTSFTDSCVEYTHCRLCGGNDLQVILDFGRTPLANAYIPVKQEIGQFPLVVHQCQSCGSTELKYGVDPAILYRNYLYESSTSGSMAAYFEKYAIEVTSKTGLANGALILEIGSNDGVLLRPLRKLGYRCVGVEPATKLCEQSRSEGFEVYPDFFDKKLASALATKHGLFDAVFINNAMAHSSYTKEIVEGAAQLLKPGGVFVFENAYWLRNIQNLYFGQVYHEHWHYFSVKPLAQLFDKAGLTLYDVEETDAQDGSIRGFACKGPKPIEKSVAARIQDEEASGLYQRDTYQKFTAQLIAIRDEIQNTLSRLKSGGHSICIYGCPAKLTTMLAFFDISQWVDYVVEDSKVKQGLLTPSGEIRIVGSDHFKQKPTDYAIIGATNFSEFIRKRNPQYKGVWIDLLPKVKLHAQAD